MSPKTSSEGPTDHRNATQTPRPISRKTVEILSKFGKIPKNDQFFFDKMVDMKIFQGWR